MIFPFAFDAFISGGADAALVLGGAVAALVLGGAVADLVVGAIVTILFEKLSKWKFMKKSETRISRQYSTI